MSTQHSSASTTQIFIVALTSARGRKAAIKWLAHGLTAGTLCLAAQPALAITVYDITLVGLYDTGHIRSSDGYQANNVQFLNTTGQVAGYASRYNGSIYTGQSAWLYSGSTTQEIGFTGAGHTRSDGYQYNAVKSLNAAGQVAGVAARYNGSSAIGTSAWLYNGSTIQEIGLTGAGYANSSTGSYSNNANYLNASGQVAGVAARYNGSTDTGTSAWLYNGSTTHEIGLTGSVHTRSDGYQYNQVLALNDAGQAAGLASRYNGSTYAGRNAWLYNGSTTHEIGLTGAVHTRSDGYQSNYADILNAAGQAVGYAERFDGSIYTGTSAWLYSDSTTKEIGLTGAGHTRSDGYQANKALHLNAVGQVTGNAERFNGSTATGSSAWLYNGSTTQEIGLTGAGHTRSDGYQYNGVQSLNAAGQVAGNATRFNGSTSTGGSAWLYNGSTTQEIGLTDAGHTRSDGYQLNNAVRLNAAGQVGGFAYRFNGSAMTGESAWFYDPLTNQTYSMDASVSALTGVAYSSIFYLGDDGLVLGQYALFDAGGASLGNRTFSFTVADGWADLGSLVDGGLNDAGWSYLATVYRSNGAGYIIGQGVLTGMSGQAAYLLTPVPEPETWAMLLAGLGLVGWSAKRRKASTAT